MRFCGGLSFEGHPSVAIVHMVDVEGALISDSH